MTSALATRIAQEYAAVAAGLPLAVVSADERERAVKTLGSQGLPVARDENWKYANLRALERVRFAPAAAGPAAVSQAALPEAVQGYRRYTFIDGVFAPELSSGTRDAAAARSSAAHRQVRSIDARFALLNDAFANDAAVLDIAAAGAEPSCTEVLFVARSEAVRAASYPRLLVRVGPGAQLNLIERHVSIESEANFVNAAVQIDLAAAASMTHYRLQEMAARSTWIDTLSANVGSEASYRQHLVHLGALAARSTLHVLLAGERASVQLHALAAGDRQQVLDAYALIEHAAPHAQSEQVFRGIAAGRARVAFNSKVTVRAGAHGTDSRQSLRGLLAGAQAEIDVRPQLEIHTDEVRCSHGATAGKLDDNVLFYLLSRGIDRDTAQQLLKWAFLADVVARIEIPDLKRSIELALAGRLDVVKDLRELI